MIAVLHLSIDIAGAATCNDEVGDSTRDADADVIVSGREPRRRTRRPGRLIRLLVVAQTAALAVAIAVAVHYRTEAGRPEHSGAQAASPLVSPMPEVTSAARPLRLLAANKSYFDIMREKLHWGARSDKGAR